jgi:hypothetical protein
VSHSPFFQGAGSRTPFLINFSSRKAMIMAAMKPINTKLKSLNIAVIIFPPSVEVRRRLRGFSLFLYSVRYSLKVVISMHYDNMN